MTAKELIDLLSALPPNTPVCVYKGGGYDCENWLMDAASLRAEDAVREDGGYDGDWSEDPRRLKDRPGAVRKVVILE